MDQQQTLELWQRCVQARADALAKDKNALQAHEAAKAIWNGWAKDILDKREELEQAGEWHAKSSVTFSTSEKPHQFNNNANFTEFVFPRTVGFDDATFKGDARFGNAKFEGTAGFANAKFEGTAGFANAKFEGTAGFPNATFKGTARFANAKFEGTAGFANAKFEGTAGFANAKFEGTAGFANAKFEGTAGFDDATFKGTAWFANAKFEGTAGFANATFKGGARFKQATFNSHTTFSKTKFESAADFEAIKAERAFSLEEATFEKIPDFIQANFTEAPRLDNADFISPFIQPRGFCASTSDTVKWLFGGKRKSKMINPPDPDLPARYRALKRLAVLGHDTDRILEFNAGEIKSRREDEGFYLGHSAGRYSFAWLYENFSDFGRSVARPFCCWFAIALLFAAIYASPWSGRENFPLLSPHFSQAVSQTLTWAETCKKVPNRNLKEPKPITLDTNALWEALVHSFRNATLILSVVQPAAEWRTLGCLYGNSKDSPLQRAIPPAASFFSALQRLLSAIFIFLFGLALRNMLKMK